MSYVNYNKIVNSICLNNLHDLFNTFGGIGTVTKRFNICNYDILGCHLHSEGNFVEIGVARGDCSKLILENIPNNYNLHLFDTFEGLVKPDEEDGVPLYHEGSLSFSLESVKDFCGEKENLFFYKGKIEDTYEKLPNDIILCHIDCDLYSGVYTSLKHVIPKLKNGGIIIIDDYNNQVYKGVDKAIEKINKELNIKIKSLFFDKSIPNAQAIYVKQIS